MENNLFTLKTKIKQFIDEINKKCKNNRSKIDREELETLLEMIENGEIDAEDVNHDCLQFDSYTLYLEQGQSNKRRIKTKNIKCQYCKNLMIKKEDIIYCAHCDIELEHKEKSTSNNNHAHFKRSIENYTGESNTPFYIEALLPDIAIWLKDLSYYKSFSSFYVHNRSSRIYENENDRIFLMNREEGFSSDDIPYINIFKHIMFYFHTYLITSVPTSSSYSEEMANLYKEKIGYTFQFKTLEKIPNLFHYGQNYYKIMIHIFNARKLELTPNDKQLIIKIFISYRAFQTEHETKFYNKEKPNTNLYFVILRNILELPYFEGRYHYILPYLAKAKKTTEMTIDNMWHNFIYNNNELKKYLQLPTPEK